MFYIWQYPNAYDKFNSFKLIEWNPPNVMSAKVMAAQNVQDVKKSVTVVENVKRKTGHSIN